MVILKGKLMRFVIYIDKLQKCMRTLQRKFVMLHVGPNMINLYLFSFKEYIDKIYALCNSQKINTTLLLLECMYSYLRTQAGQF